MKQASIQLFVIVLWFPDSYLWLQDNDRSNLLSCFGFALLSVQDAAAVVLALQPIAIKKQVSWAVTINMGWIVLIFF